MSDCLLKNEEFRKMLAFEVAQEVSRMLFHKGELESQIKPFLMRQYATWNSGIVFARLLKKLLRNLRRLLQKHVKILSKARIEMSLIRDLAQRYMGEGGREAMEDRGQKVLCHLQFSCDPPFDGEACAWNGEFCAYGCVAPNFVCSNSIVTHPIPCQPTWGCPIVYTCGTGERDIFICGSVFEGCGEDIDCSGKFLKCGNGMCPNLASLDFDCTNFSCSANLDDIPFQCLPHGFICSDSSGGSYDCHHTYCCATPSHEYVCTQKHNCADYFDCIDTVHLCVNFMCGTGDLLDRFDCSDFDYETCPAFECNNYSGE